MTSRAERERKRKAAQAIKRAISLGGGASVPQKPQGRDRSHTHKPEDARRPVLQARCRIAGIDATPDAIQAAVDPLMGHDEGRCIRHIHGSSDTAAALHDAWQSMSIARRTWRLRYTGQSGDPQGASIGVVPDRMETDPGMTVDLRTPDERDRDAARAEAQWKARIAAVPHVVDRMALRSAIDGFGMRLWHNAAPTAQGRSFVRALVAIVEAEK